jgi:hypothetical protein
MVNVFYLSNVEDYIRPVLDGYARNIRSLPIDASSRFIRVSLGANAFRPWIELISRFVPPQGRF